MITLKPLWGYLAYHNISIAELSRRSGVATITLHNMKKNNTFTGSVLDKICTTLNINISQIMRYENTL